MPGNDPFDTPPEQLTLSYELLYLLQWIIENEQETLKVFIQEAVRRQQAAERHQKEHVYYTQDDELQQNIVDFFAVLDALLYEAVEEESVHKATQKNLLPSLNQIDSAICDTDTLQSTVEETTAHLDAHPEQNAKDVLHKKLLQQWEPDEQTLAN
ncbi:MAG: hypothetical protein AB7F19_00385 [Candidatus Babeliales bacterium]